MPDGTPRLDTVLAINGGSSSIKFALFGASEPMGRILSGKLEGVGQPAGVFTAKGADKADDVSKSVAIPDHAAAVDLLVDWLQERIEPGALVAVGHRVVHGGPKYWEPQQVTPEMIAELRQLSSFDPEHLPDELRLIEGFQHRFPDLPQIACFDTAFHHDMPRVACQLPIPRRYEAKGVRRYGFHGLSCAFLMEELARIGGSPVAEGRVILAHLGSGASMTAVRNGQSVDTSMAFTPAAGLPMSSRTGDLDPGVAYFLARTEHMTPGQFNKMVNHESGLLGVSETSSDMRELLAREAADGRAAEAVALFCYQAKKWIGAYAAALGGLDTLVFAGGIGESAAPVRARICAGLEFLGLELDAARNDAHANLISTDASRVSVRVIRTDEEIMIARSVRRLLE
jgi:acetate kinase